MDLAFPDHPLPGGVVDGLDGLLHVVHPALLVEAILVPALCHHAAMAIAAAPGLAHVQGHDVLPVVGQVKVGGEHGGGHVAQLRAHDVPGTGIQLLFHPVVGELDDTARHVLVLIPGIAEDAAQPCVLLAELGYIPLVKEVLQIFVAACGHIHHVGNVADRAGALLKIRLQDAHDLKQVGAEGRDLPHSVVIRLLLGDQLTPDGLHAASALLLVQ